MGIFWRFTMPLLSTLAALVIIVHSAEEELDPGFRRDLRPRAVDPGTNSYEQPWKAIDAEPLAQKSTRADDWHVNSAEELTERRRPVRKRKRRPQTSSELEPEGGYREGPEGPYQDTDYHDSYQTTEMTRRRRKRPDVRPYRWADEPLETDRERPLRRRGLRRKRPTFDSNLQLSEFNHWNPKEENREEYNTKQTESYYAEEKSRKEKKPQHFDSDPHSNVDYKIKIDESNEERTLTERPKISNYNEMHFFNEDHKKYRNWNMQISSEDRAKSEEKAFNDENEQYTTKAYAENGDDQQPKQLSEFSTDMLFSKSLENSNLDVKVDSSSANVGMDFNKKAKINEPIDPYALKQILKKSNGTSLSEILQRNNLSLSDLLHGRGEAILALNKDTSKEALVKEPHHLQKAESQYIHSKQTAIKDGSTTTTSINADEIEATQTGSPDIQIADNVKNNTGKERQDLNKKKDKENIDQPVMVGKRRFPTEIRRKLTMRPMLNSTLKAQLGRDLIALSARRSSNNNNTTLSKSKEWKDIIPMMLNKSTSISNDDTGRDDTTEPIPTATEKSIDTTTPDLDIVNTSVSLNITDNSNASDNEVETTKLSTTEPPVTITFEILHSGIINETEKPIVSLLRHTKNNSTLRRQEFNNKLKRKRLKQKSSTTANPNDELTEKTLRIGTLVSASHFIERTQKPHATVTQENNEFALELEDFMTTPVSTTVQNKVKSTLITNPINKSSLSTTTSTTEQTAKFEIEEILNDTMTSERLERILQERNMTLSELVMHRERGSSHVHLADIFHNASKEPNPPEPFLTKSSIEPISKETYPLRAILEANIHETTAKSPTVNTTIARGNDVHIPVVMDFGNNVNENGENMGIISLFNQLTENEGTVEKTELQKDSNGIPYLSTIVNVNATNKNDKNRESRVLSDEDVDGWNVLLALMTNDKVNHTKENPEHVTAGTPEKSNVSVEDIDGDGLIILEDLQHLKEFESNIATASDEKIEIKMFESNEKITDSAGILNKLPNTTRSVAIATASFLGLATILFLLTYIALKYKQPRRHLRKKDSLSDDRIPTPVFEHRKGHKNHCSSRSISPMISNSNIYTMSPLDSHDGKESPDYMWNSLRKPFQ